MKRKIINKIRRYFCYIKTLLMAFRWKGYIWLPEYLKGREKRKYIKRNIEKREIDVIFIMVDHFEPARKEGVEGVKKVRQWCEAYKEVAQKHRDSDGKVPQHTWFYRYDYPNFECLKILNEYVYGDLGEIEFHLHHGNDSSENFSEKISEGVKWFNQAGAMISGGRELKRNFGYIAGNWALDNGRREDSLSGVNNELEILGRAGCYADFTFPAFGTNAQPRKVNSIFYATDTPAPKSYNTGKEIKVGGKKCGDLIIFQGPMFVDWEGGYIEYAAMESYTPFFPERINYWLSAGVHVEGRPEWIFIKLHTHGMQSRHELLGGQLEKLFDNLENRLAKNPYRLHYASAREGYNILKAAEAGEVGNPNEFRNYDVGEPINKKIFSDGPIIIREYSQDKIDISLEGASNGRIFKFREIPIEAIEGVGMSRIEMVGGTDKARTVTIYGEGKCSVKMKNQVINNCSLPSSFSTI